MVNDTPLQVKQLETRAKFSRRVGVSAAAVTKACATILKPALVGKRIDVTHAAAIAYVRSNADASTKQPATGIDELYEQAVAYCQKIKRISTSALQREFKIGYARAARITATMKVNKVVINMVPGPPPPPPETKRVAKGGEVHKQTKKSEALEKLNTIIDQGGTLHEIPDDILKFLDMTLRELIKRFGTEGAFIDWLKATKSIEEINEKRLKNAATRGELVNRNLIKIGVFDPVNTAFNKMLTDGAKTIARRVHAMAGSGRKVEDCEHFVADQISSFIKPAKSKIIRTLKNL